MEQEKMIRLSSIKTTLHKLVLDSIATNNTKTQLNVIIKDHVRTDTIDENGFSIIHTRRVAFEPGSLFTISVAYRLQCIFTDDSKEYFEGDIEKIKSFIDKRKYEILTKNDVLSRMTNLIATLSKEYRSNPLIVPPYFEKNSSLHD